MSNAFMGQRQSASPFGFGGYSGGMGLRQDYGPSFAGRFTDYMGSSYGGGMGGYNPFGGGGYGTQFGDYDMSGYGGGGFGGYGGGMRAPAYEPTINDAFSRYFSQQYYGGPAFDPFAATSFFGGGFGGGFGFGGGGRRGGGMGGRMRRRRQMFEDLFQPEQPPQPQPQPMPVEDTRARIQPMPIGGGAFQPGGGGQRIEMGAAQPTTGGSLFSSFTSTQPTTLPYSNVNPYANETDAQRNKRINDLIGMPQPDLMMRPAVMPQPYMGGFSFPFDQALPAKSEAPSAPAVQGFDSIMPVQMQDTPVQSAPAYAPAPYTPPAPTYTEPMQYTPPAPSYAEPIQYIPPAPTYMEPEQYIPLNIAPRFSPFARSSREMLELDF